MTSQLWPVRGLGAGLAALAVMLAGSALAQQTPAAGPASTRDPTAIEAVVAMGKYLRSLKSFQVTAETTIDQVLQSNQQKLQFSGTVDYKVRMPDRARIEVRNDRRWRDVVYDGKSVTQLLPRMNYYATIPAPGTIGEAIVMVDQKFDVEVPLADLFLWGTDKSGIDDIKEAQVIGASKIGGRSCTQYAFRQEGVDWQLWILDGKQPLPCKLVITTTSEPTQPQYSAVLKWNLAPKLGAGTFAFVPPKGAKKIDIVPVSK